MNIKRIRMKEIFRAELYFSPLCVHKFEIFSPVSVLATFSLAWGKIFQTCFTRRGVEYMRLLLRCL